MFRRDRLDVDGSLNDINYLHNLVVNEDVSSRFERQWIALPSSAK